MISLPTPPRACVSALIIVLAFSACAFADENESGRFRLGLRAAVGASGFHGHRAVESAEFGGYAINPQPAVSVCAGLAADIAAGEIFSVAIEPQYTLYRSRAGFTLRDRDADTRTKHTAGVSLHAAELPILARFRAGIIYLESGLQPGINTRARVSGNDSAATSRTNRFSCGMSAGLGADVKGILFGLRGYYSLTEYDKNNNGYPWSIRGGVTKFFIF